MQKLTQHTRDSETCPLTITDISLQQYTNLNYSYHSCNANCTDRSPPVLAWAGPSSLMGREKPSKSKGLNTLHPRRAGRWCIFNRGHCCSSPTYKCPWEESSTKTKFNWNFQPTAVSLVSFCMVLVKSPGWWCCLCSVVRLPKVFLLDAIKSWFDAVRSTWSFYLSATCYLFFYFCLLYT